jgi:hypothetical protein
MTTVMRDYPLAKGKMSVAPVQWLPGALAAMLPFFAIQPEQPNTLFLRADDPNIHGVYTAGLMTSPVVEKAGVQKCANKGFNFYCAPWSIQTLPARDIGTSVEIRSVDKSVTDYITSLYSLLGPTPIVLADWKFEQSGFAKLYQVLQGDLNTNRGGTMYFGGAGTTPTQVSGVSELSLVLSPLITNDFTFNGALIPTYQMPYNTFYAVETPIILSAVDTANIEQPRLYFTLLNNVTLYNGQNYNG